MEEKKFIETANTIHGRLLESVHITGYSAERACIALEWLLDEDRWKTIGNGFKNINDFLETINLSQFKIAVDKRKKLAKKLDDLQATQRSTAKALGVNEITVARDIGKNRGATNVDNKKNKQQYNEVEENKTTNVTLFPLNKSGQEVAQTIEKETKKEIKNKERERKHEEKKQNIIQTFTYKTIDEITKQYDIIYADPPWKYNDKGETKQISGYGTVQAEYTTMSLSEIKKMNIKKLQKKDCVLFLWVTSPYLEMSFEVINSWGFKYKSSFVWDKIKHNMGFYNSVRHEILLIATKGSITPWNKQLFDSVYLEERKEHSKKPKYFYIVIETLYPGGDYIELFATQKRTGWDSWGNVIEN